MHVAHPLMLITANQGVPVLNFGCPAADYNLFVYQIAIASYRMIYFTVGNS